MTHGMKYDFQNMTLVITDVNKQLKYFIDTLDSFRNQLTSLTADWEGGASAAANTLGRKLENQGREISGTVTRFVAAMQTNMEQAMKTERDTTAMFQP